VSIQSGVVADWRQNAFVRHVLNGKARAMVAATAADAVQGGESTT
jgi:hypothetical protein